MYNPSSSSSVTRQVQMLNGGSTVYSLSGIPGSTNNLFISVEGIELFPGTDYSVSGNSVTFLVAPPAGTNNVMASWISGGGGSGGGSGATSVERQVQTFNGGGSVFILSSAPGVANNLEVVINGFALTPGVDFTLSGTTLTLTTASPAGTANVVAKWGTGVSITTTYRVVQTFNGGSTVYSLSSDPGSVQNLEVSIDGFVLTPVIDYTLLGTNLTLTSVASAGTDNVMARWGLFFSAPPAYQDWQNISFNGTGLQTVFTLPSSPTSLGNIDVTVDGITLSAPSEFTISGTSLTFVSAPPAGTGNIYVRYGQSLPIGSIAANGVTFASGKTAQDISGTGIDQGAAMLGLPGGGTVDKQISGWVTVTNFGAPGTIGTGNAIADTAAINAAVATGKKVFFPYGSYKYNGNLLLAEGGIFGEGYGIGGAGAKFSVINFYNCTSVTRGAVYTTKAAQKSHFVEIKDIYLAASSWDPFTGCAGYGVELEAAAILKNVTITGFKKSGFWAHHSLSASGPYESILENVRSVNNGQHGFLVGSGANSMTFLNCEGKWSGTPSFGVSPTAAGSFDGFYLDDTSDGGSYPSFKPTGIKIIGGDYSYNSRYGVNAADVDGAYINLSFSELNLSSDSYGHRSGTLHNSHCDFGFTSALGTASLKVDTTNSALSDGNRIIANGYDYGGSSDVGQTSIRDKSKSTLGGARDRVLYLGASDVGATNMTAIQADADGNAYYITGGTGSHQFLSGARFGNSANVNANTLDWYEEGTFTPTVIGTTLAGVGTYSLQDGSFTRIGNRVSFNLSITWSAHSGTGSVKISGLPYSSASGSAFHAMSIVYDGIVVGAGKEIGGAIPGGSTQVSIYSQDQAGGAISLLSMDTAGTLHVSGQYKV